METRAHYILIGAFMLSAIVLTILFALWLGTVERETDEYDVVFRERVSGLSVGSAVLFNGISVGEVRTLNWAPNNPDQVIARVRVRQDTPIKIDTKAELELVGVTGLSVIQFSGGKPGSPLLKDVSRKRIPQLEASLSVAASIIEGGDNIVASIQQVLDEKNVQSFGEILVNVEDLTGLLVEEKETIRGILNETHEISQNLAGATGELEELTRRADSLLAKAERLVETDARQMVGSVNSSAEELQALIDELRIVVARNQTSIDEFTSQGLGEAAAAIADLRRLLRTTEDVMREFEQDPARFLFGETAPEVRASR